MCFTFPVVLTLGAMAFALAGMSSGIRGWMVFVSILLAALAIVLAVVIFREISLPRLGYENGYLLVFLVGRQPIRVPIEIVEVFFLGQGPSLVKTKDGKSAEAATIVIRLAESAREWHNRNVRTTLGQWADGYIVIRGTWCEPINGKLLKWLNERLVTAHRQQRRTADSQAVDNTVASQKK